MVKFRLFSLYLLCHVGLGKVVEDESNLLLDIFRRLDNPFCLVSGHQQCVNVCCVYGGLKEGTKTSVIRYPSFTCRTILTN